MSSNVYRILLIENDSRLSHQLRDMLSSEGPTFDLITAQSSKDGLETLARENIDAILVHIAAAEAQTFENFVKFRALTYSLPIVALISGGTETLGQQAMSLGAADYLSSESLNRELLRRSLRSVIELERAKAATRQVERRFDELLDNTTDILFTMDLDGRFTSLNKAAERVMGWPRSEAFQKNLKDLVAPEHQDFCSQMMERILREESIPNFEVALLRNDGRRVFLEASVRVIESNGQKQALQGIARDVTERRSLEHQLRQIQKLEAIGRLSGGLAHDFNNLLCVISGHTEILFERLQNTVAIRSVTQIKKATDSAAALTRQLLAFSRKQVFHPRTMDLNAIVLETERLLERLIGEHIEFFTALDPALGQVHVDPVQIEQVLVNLVLNARDAMPQGGKLTIETRNVSFEDNQESASPSSIIPSGKYALLAVTDTGCGMDEETQSRLFEPFYTTKELGKGTGLGLATVYGIVKQSGGFVWVYSELGRGTTFKIYLPRVSGLADPPPITRQDIMKCSGTETILLVEDAEPLRALTKGFLEDAGYKVLEADNGKHALQVAREFDGPIHLLLTDVVMPGIGGKDLADQLGILRPELKVLFISGYPNDAITQSGRLISGAELLEKPFSRELLWLKVRQVLSVCSAEKSIVPSGEPV